MIFGTKDTISTYKGLGDKIDRAIDFIMNLNDNIETGRYEIDGDEIYANVMCGETTSMDEVKFEAHKKYIDLQYIVDGSEIMVYAPLAECKQETEYNEESDFYLFSGSGSEMKAKKGDFYLLYPFDAHAPTKGYETTSFKKVVVKIKL